LAALAEQEAGCGMNVQALEQVFRRVVREELAAAGVGAAESVMDPEPVVDKHPFDLTDAELRTAELLMDEVSGRILRHRVMAFRLEKMGSPKNARAHQRKAEGLLKQQRAGMAERRAG